VSTIIECPACSTRYKMNKSIPDSGRHVKCARCGHQWHLVPESEVETDSETREDHGNSMAIGQTATTGPMERGLGDETDKAAAGHHEHRADPWGSSLTEEQTDNWASSNTASGDTSDWSSHSGVTTQTDDWASRNTQSGHTIDWNTHRDVSDDVQDDTATYEDDTAAHDQHDETAHQRVSLQDSWMAETTVDTSADTDFDNDTYDDTQWSDDRNSWRHDVAGNTPTAHVQSPSHEDDPENAIRRALKNALENPGDDPTNKGDPFSDFWAGEGAKGLGFEDRRPEAIAAQLQNVRRSSVLFDTNTARHGYVDDDVEDQVVDDDDNIPTFREPVQKRPAFRPEYRHDPSITDYDAVSPAAGHPNEQYNVDFLSNDTVALQAELENFGHMAYDEPRRGLLALMAAWAMFLALAGGTVSSLIGFRDNVVAAVPGTARLYNILGFEVAGHNLDFNNVAYRWKESEGQPVIEVTGQITNQTNRALDVPPILINHRDGQTGEMGKATEKVRNEPLAAGETIPFKLEVMSPSKSVTQVQLEFDQEQK
jgi:predicted Zn finger-like uncharacterized protein